MIVKLASRAFWQYAAERAIKTAAQSASALLGVGYLGLVDVDWAAVGSASGLAALLSLLTSLQRFKESHPEPAEAAQDAQST
ncbi:holin [Plantactinospora sp. WMMB782]|uniref:holin n=1 Tax=Plantactinospora sp. WMMB782 TaxID=3404121 RepID=UPI003B96202B